MRQNATSRVEVPATGSILADERRRAVHLGELLAPMTVWTVAAIVGALFGEVAGEVLSDRHARTTTMMHGPDLVLWLGALVGVLALVVVAVAIAVRNKEERRVIVGTIGAVLVLLVVGVAAASRVLIADVGLLPMLAAEGGEAELSTTVIREPRPVVAGWHVVVRVHSVDGIATRETAALTLVDDPPVLGSRWAVRATARPVPEGGYGRWISRQHVAVILDVADWEAAGAPGWLAAASEHVRERIRVAATHHLDERYAGLLVGLVSGDTRLLPANDQQAMQATSLTHLTAVSGAHVAIVLGGMTLLLNTLTVGAAWRRRVTIVTILAFAFVTRFEPSVLRASSMALLVLLTHARGMARDTRHSLGAAVLLLILIDPRLAGSVGLLLSATATAGVLVLSPMIAQRLHRLPRRLRTVTSITLGAQIAVIPLLLTTFGEVPLASVPANIVAVPAAMFAATLSFIGALIALVYVPVGAAMFWLAGFPARIVLGCAHSFSGVGGVADVGRPLTVIALASFCVWLLADVGRRTSRRIAVVVALSVLATVLPQVAGGFPPRHLTVTAIDVGQGDAFLIESRSLRMLVDAGHDATAARWLRQNGRRRLDLLVITHPHRDHVGGATEVLRSVQVGAVWYRPLPTELPEAHEVLEVADELEIPVLAPVAGDIQAFGTTLVEVLHPPPGRPYRWSGSELNDTSIVFRVDDGGRQILATGDIEQAAQVDLLARHGASLRSAVLTVPHHGAATSDPDFLTAVAPQLALIGVGAENRYGHPHPETLKTLTATGAQIRRTDLEGTIRVRVPYTRRPAAEAIPALGRSTRVGCWLDEWATSRNRSGVRSPPRHPREGQVCPSS